MLSGADIAGGTDIRAVPSGSPWPRSAPRDGDVQHRVIRIPDGLHLMEVGGAQKVLT
jgi:hypothetical protein